ncbi:hypothetical protein [Bacillus sp. AFS055030]|uniref:hypothetical protein n=1 Tax=Bacillus sp. AFS055030 TaxID=2033507 RepID=UPI000BFB96ED|nr:hypothetical protein [Bacillus sp. AFS055030]PGL70899.1 hypothetical protein CN925_10335 [Bacillus sp. AFS055030]
MSDHKKCSKCNSKPCCCKLENKNKIQNNPINTFNPTINIPELPGSFSPAFGNFFRIGFQTIPPNTAMIWTNTGASSGGVFLASPNQIGVTQEGFYYIHYTVSVEMSTLTNIMALMGIFINNNEVPNLQSRNAVTNVEADRSECTNLTGGTIVFIPANALVELRSILNTIETCAGFDIAGAINLIKLS